MIGDEEWLCKALGKDSGGITDTEREIAKRIVDYITKKDPQGPPIQKALPKVVEKMGFNWREVASNSRIREVTDIRHMCFHYVSKHTKTTFKEIREITGINRTRATIINSIKYIDSQLPINTFIAKDYKRFCALMKEEMGNT